MSEHDPVIVASELVTGYGFGERLCWEGLLSGRHAFREIERFDAFTACGDGSRSVCGTRWAFLIGTDA